MKEESKAAYLEAIGALDAQFRHARRLHKEAAANVENAREKAQEARRLPTYDTAQRLKREQAELDYKLANEALRPAVEKIWSDYGQSIRTIRAQLMERLNMADVYKAADVDQAALALLQSGIMRPRDFQQMAEDFSENPAILAILRQTAKKVADGMGEEQYQERAELYAIARDAKTDGETLLQSFDDLDTMARMFSGGSNGYFPDPGHTSSLDAWEAATREIINGNGQAESGDVREVNVL